ncbi:MAG: hypothetical protein JSW25_01560 [Thermoplasmata archaeon]|nr:MAG: hypothetical protein JSW25_01560 [Thermoplasmata archaeon]
MPPEEEDAPEDADEWAAEREERAPEFMEPVVEVDDGEEDGVDTGKARKERDAAASTLYRERRTVEEVVEEEEKPAPKRLTRAEKRAQREQRRLDREVERMERSNGSTLRSSLAYKTFYDMVCNRVGVIIAGFGVAMILFTVSYDWLQGSQLSLGPRHLFALVISIVVYGIGMALEGLRILSPECEGLEARALRAQAAGEGANGPMKAAPEPKPIPMIPDEALEKLNGNDGD